MALDHAGLAASARGEFAASRAFHEEAVAIDRAAGNRGYEAISLEAWSAGTYYQGDYELARTLAEASLAIVDALDHDSGEIRVDANVTLFILGRIALYNGDTAAARRHFEANLAHWWGMGDARCRPAVGALVGLGCVAVIEGDLAQARGLSRGGARRSASGSGSGRPRPMHWKGSRSWLRRRIDRTRRSAWSAPRPRCAPHCTTRSLLRSTRCSNAGWGRLAGAWARRQPGRVASRAGPLCPAGYPRARALN